MVTIDVSEDVWRYLQLRKDPGDSFNDVLERELLGDDVKVRDTGDDVNTTANLDEAQELSFPANKDRTECLEAIEAAAQYVKTNNGASMREIVANVMPDHDLGYDVPELQEGDRYRGSWWRKVVKPGLEHDDRVKKPTSGQHEWV